MARLPSPGQTASLWVVDGNHPYWDALTWTDQLMGNVTTKVFSVADLVTVCARDAIANSRTIDLLAIFGHGTGGYQSIGAGKRYEETGDRSLLYKGIVARGGSHLNGSAEAKLTALNGLLSSQATIFLAGCNVGGVARGLVC